MNFVSGIIFFLCALGISIAQQPNIQFNRLKIVSNDISANQQDQDDLKMNNNIVELKSRMSNSIIHQPETLKEPIKIYKPREDPRLFYLSDAYTKNLKTAKIDEGVTSVHLDQVIHANEKMQSASLPHLNNYKQYRKESHVGRPCVLCPRDKTLIAKKGSNLVYLRRPRLMSCSGRPAIRSVHYVHMYGPKFGSLLEVGSHTIVGKLIFKNRVIQYCKMQADVIAQGCRAPNHLEMYCENNNNCTFTCRDTRLQLQGPSSAICGPDMKWNIQLPQCQVLSGCTPPEPPEHGRIYCHSKSSSKNVFVEGTECRVRCKRGWRSNTRGSPSICQHGSWDKPLMCQSRRKN